MTDAAGFAAVPTAVLLIGSTRAKAGDPSFANNVPDSVLAGKSLPTFKFELEKSTGKVVGNSSGRESTVEQLPISKGIAGVSMRLEPGAMRELHWHATAAEWAFAIEGNVRATVIDPQGGAKTNDFAPGDVRHSNIRHNHMHKYLTNQHAHFILTFDNGYFSGFGTFSITDWLSNTSKALLAKNFGLPESSFDGFPKEDVYFAHDAVPPEKATAPIQGWKPQALTHKYWLLERPSHRTFQGGREWRLDPSVYPISKTITGVILDLEPGALRELH